VFPTCNRRAKDCDLDHLLAWRDHGETKFDNLASECPRHHQVKHEADWTVQRLPDGTVRWTSPTGTPTTDPSTHSTSTAPRN
jgi:hypothetical protein